MTLALVIGDDKQDLYFDTLNSDKKTRLNQIY